jgi:hypothetical protein
MAAFVASNRICDTYAWRPATTTVDLYDLVVAETKAVSGSTKARLEGGGDD